MSRPTDPDLKIPEDCPADSAEKLACHSAHFLEPTMTRQLLDAVPSILFVLNDKRQIVFANNTLCRLLDVDNFETLLGKRPGDVMSCQSALLADEGCGTGEACVTCGALRAIISGLNGQEDVQECLLARQVNQDLVPMTLRVWSVPMDYHGAHYVILTGVDISHERRRLALEKTFFHDILNLVGSIRGFAELMEIDETVDPGDVSRRIQLASQRVIDEIDMQRMLLTAERGELQTNPSLLSSRQVLDELMVLYSAQEQTMGRTLALDGRDEEIAFQSDAVVLRRILGNMVKNALEASQPGEAVTLGARQQGSQLDFRVHNPAVIPDQDQPRIFQRDFSTKGPGRGLGTYSMSLLTKVLGGEISFDSSADSGTIFSLRIPL